MYEEPRQVLERVNTGLAQALQHLQGALSGTASFGARDVRCLRTLLAEMEPLLGESTQLRETQPELGPELDRYTSQLLELQKMVERLRVGLLVQQTALEEKRTQIAATSQW